MIASDQPLDRIADQLFFHEAAGSRGNARTQKVQGAQRFLLPAAYPSSDRSVLTLIQLSGCGCATELAVDELGVETEILSTGLQRSATSSPVSSAASD